MRKKTGRKSWLKEAFLAHQSELGQRAREFIEWLRVKNYAATTIYMRMEALHYCLCWGEERAITKVTELTAEILESYAKHLLYSKDASDQPRSANNRRTYLAAISKFCWWLMQQDFLPTNPAAKLVYPKVEKKLPRNVLSHTQIEHILSLPDMNTPLGIRDRAILELLYSTGMRRAEACALTLHDVDMQNGIIYIRHGKGDKARVVPIGDRALQWLNKYLGQVRGVFDKDKRSSMLFLTYTGVPICLNRLSKLVKSYVKLCGFKGCCHIFRHAMATQMLDNGADLRHIQMILGHADIATTQIYTHVSMASMQRTYREHHPANSHSAPQIEEVNSKIHKRHSSPRPPKGPRKALPENELGRWAQEYLTALRLLNYSDYTVGLAQGNLCFFIEWCQEQGVTLVAMFTPALLEKYHSFVRYRQPQGRPLTPERVARLLAHACRFCRFLADKQVLAYDITQKIELPRVNRSIPCQVLNEQEVVKILAQPDVRTALGLRDRAAMEILYATGIRWCELQTLELDDINSEAATVFIRNGKGSKDRIVPIALGALAWVEKYLELVRPLLCRDETQKLLFLTNGGCPFEKSAFNRKLNQYARAAGIDKPVSCHKFRHAMATALLDHGADMRTVQELLGHERLSSTQVYTHVAIRKLKEVHDKTHPARSKPSPKQE